MLVIKQYVWGMTPLPFGNPVNGFGDKYHIQVNGSPDEVNAVIKGLAAVTPTMMGCTIVTDERLAGMVVVYIDPRSSSPHFDADYEIGYAPCCLSTTTTSHYFCIAGKSASEIMRLINNYHTTCNDPRESMALHDPRESTATEYNLRASMALPLDDIYKKEHLDNVA